MSKQNNTGAGKFPATLFLLFLLSLSVVVAESYPLITAGSFDVYFDTDPTATTKSVSIANQRYLPVTGDLNNDGDYEVYQLTTDSIRAYYPNNMSTLDVRTLTTSSFAAGGQPFIFDTDGDGDQEINVVFFESNETYGVSSTPTFTFTAKAYSLNASNELNLDFERQCWRTGTTGGLLQAANSTFQTQVGCSEINGDCGVVWRYDNSQIKQVGGATGTRIGFFNINSTDCGTYSFHAGESACLSPVPQLDVADLDGDGEEEYAVAYIDVEGDSSADEIIYVKILDKSSGTYSVSHTATINIGDEINMGSGYYTAMAGQDSCAVDYEFDGLTGTGRRFLGELVTPAFITNRGNSDLNDYEVIVGYMNGGNDAEVRVYSADLSSYNEKNPAIGSDGNSLSNFFEADVIVQGGTSEWCHLIYDYDARDVHLHCEDPREGADFDDTTNQVVPIGYWLNASDDYIYNPTLPVETAYASNFAAATSSYYGVAVDEILFGAGFLKPDHNDVGADSVRYESSATDLPSFTFPAAFAAGILKTSNENNYEILSTTGELLTLYGDNTRNRNCADDGCLDSAGISVNPAICDNIALQNTTIRFTTSVFDADLDEMVVNISMYDESSTSHQHVSNQNVSSGSTTQHNFVANETGLNVPYTIRIADEVEPTKIQTYSGVFTVSATTGYSFGDNSCTLGFSNPESSTSNTSSTSPTTSSGSATNTQSTETNAVTSITSEASAFTGLSGIAIYLFIMAIIAGTIWLNKGSSSGGEAFGVIVIVEVIMVVIGFMAGVFSFAIFLVTFIVLLAGVALALMLRSGGSST